MNKVYFQDGEELDIHQINEAYPFTMLINSSTVLRVSEFIAESVYEIDVKTLNFKILVNFLCQRSRKVKSICALICLSEVKKIKRIDADYIDESFMLFFDSDIIIEKNNPQKQYLNREQKLSSLFKYFPNKLFLLIHLLFFRNYVRRNILVRAWVDVDEKLHKDKIKDATIFIYPFGISLIRSLKFIVHIHRKYESYSLMGINYSIFKLLRAFFDSVIRKNDFGFVLYETSGMLGHRINVSVFSEIYTSDEYQPAVFALYHELSSSITNVCHGIGYYNRFINYDYLEVFNQLQKEYYSELNDNVKVNVNYSESKDLVALNSKSKVLVIIDQGELLNYNLIYESQIQLKILAILNSAKINEAGFKVLVKFHPNRSHQSKRSYLSKYLNFVELKSVETIGARPIFINLYSTAYYDFRSRGTFIFITDSLFKPQKLFGNKIQTIDLVDLENRLLKLS